MDVSLHDHEIIPESHSDIEGESQGSRNIQNCESLTSDSIAENSPEHEN